MIKNLIFPLIVSLLLVGCKDENQTSKEGSTPSAGIQLDSILHNYYEDGLKLNPISATTSGDMRYNDQFPNFLSEAYEDSLRNYYTTYRDRVQALDDTGLSETERMSKNILLWEANINLESLEFAKNKYMPIDQMWSVNLFVGQLASGAGAQPFNTVEDYRNWLKRVEGYLEWMTTARERMSEGMGMGYVLPVSLITKVIPQFAAMTNENVEEHLFFGPVNSFPDSFTEEEKQQLTTEYKEMISKKVIPAYKEMHDFMPVSYTHLTLPTIYSV